MGRAYDDIPPGVIGSTIKLRSGAYLDVARPDPQVITLFDIAHGLSNVCRFAGQCSHFYSVAEHSIHVSMLVPEEDAWAALMHDAAEAFIGDVSKPLKILLPDYAEIEERMEAAVFQQMGINLPLPASIKRADLIMLAVEKRALFETQEHWPMLDGVEVPDIPINCLTPNQARTAFIARATQIRFEQGWDL